MQYICLVSDKCHTGEDAFCIEFELLKSTMTINLTTAVIAERRSSSAWTANRAILTFEYRAQQEHPELRAGSILVMLRFCREECHEIACHGAILLVRHRLTAYITVCYMISAPLPVILFVQKMHKKKIYDQV